MTIREEFKKFLKQEEHKRIYSINEIFDYASDYKEISRDDFINYEKKNSSTFRPECFKKRIRY